MKPTNELIRAGLFAGMLGVSTGASAETLTIVIEDIRDAGGAVRVQVLAGQEQYEGDGEAAQFAAIFRELAAEGALTLTAENLPSGEYAIRMFHDVNGNGELDTNIVGRPTEPYAFSNNARGMFGPPAWEDARFVLEGDVTQVIGLIH